MHHVYRMRLFQGLLGIVALGVVSFGGEMGTAQASAVVMSCDVAGQEIVYSVPGAVNSVDAVTESAVKSISDGEMIIRSLQQRGIPQQNYKIAEVDDAIVLDAVAMAIGPDIR